MVLLIFYIVEEYIDELPTPELLKNSNVFNLL